MIVRCIKCSARLKSATDSDQLALWLLQVHHWFRHWGKKPEVVTDGDPLDERRETMAKIKLGQVVRDTISGNEGTAVARTEWLNGCVRISIQPEGSKDGNPYSTFVVDEPQLEVVKRESAPKAKPAHGPRDDPGRAPDPQ